MITFKGLSTVRNGLRPESGSLKLSKQNNIKHVYTMKFELLCYLQKNACKSRKNWRLRPAKAIHWIENKCRLLHFSTNWWYLLEISSFQRTFFLQCPVLCINFYFQLDQTFQLFEINFQFVENVKRALNYPFNWIRFLEINKLYNVITKYWHFQQIKSWFQLTEKFGQIQTFQLIKSKNKWIIFGMVK